MRLGFASIGPRASSPANALGHQRIHLAASTMARIAIVSGATLKSCRRAAKRQPAQDAHRVFGENRRTWHQHPGLQVALPAVRIDQRALGIARHRVDGQVAPRFRSSSSVTSGAACTTKPQ